MKTFANFAVLQPSTKVLSADFGAGGRESVWAGGIPHVRKVEVRVLLHVFVCCFTCSCVVSRVRIDTGIKSWLAL